MKTFTRNAARRPAVDRLEDRRLMAAANAVKVVDTDGPIDHVKAKGDFAYVVSPTASGGAYNQLFRTDGKTTETLVNWKRHPRYTSIDEPLITDDGRVLFAASGAETRGKQIFIVDGSKNSGASPLTKLDGAFFQNLFEVGDHVVAYEGTSDSLVSIGRDGGVTTLEETVINGAFRQSGDLLFFGTTDGKVLRTDGTADGTYLVTGNVSANTRTMFAAGGSLYFEGQTVDGFFRASPTGGEPTMLTDDFGLLESSTATLGDWTYLSGGFSNLHPRGGQLRELYRVHNVTGELERLSDVNPNGGGDVTGIGAIGTNVYFTGFDGEFLSTEGQPDRELFRYDTIAGEVTQVTDDGTLVPAELGGGVLGSYYFVAAPEKVGSRFGDRRLYRTDPATDEVVMVANIPTVTDSNGRTFADISSVAVTGRGFFFEAKANQATNDTDLFFSASPFSVLGTNRVLTIQTTADDDTLTITRDGDELVLTLDGVEERHLIADVDTIETYLGAGDDRYTASNDVTLPTYVFGDLGNDAIQAGGGRDTISGGAGKNRMFGGDAADRINGSGGADFLDGQAGDDRLYGRGGNDELLGGSGVDRLFGDDENGPFGDDVLRGGTSNDKLYGYGGNDVLFGQRQSDLLFGGDGDDQLFGGEEGDTLDGGAGDDKAEEDETDVKSAIEEVLS